MTDPFRGFLAAIIKCLYSTLGSENRQTGMSIIHTSGNKKHISAWSPEAFSQHFMNMTQPLELEILSRFIQNWGKTHTV